MEEKYGIKGFNRQRIHRNGTPYDDEGYDYYGYNRDGYDRAGFNRHKMNKQGINKKTGLEDERVTLIKKYLESPMSKETFCGRNHISMKRFNSMEKAVLESFTEITKEQLEKKAQENARSHYYLTKKVADELTSGKMSIMDFMKIGIKFNDVISAMESQADREKITIELLKCIENGEMSIDDYRKIFVTNDVKLEKIYQEIEKQFMNMIKIAQQNPEYNISLQRMYAEKRRISKYKTPFRGTLKSIGIMDKDTGKMIKMEITDKHIKYAKRYIAHYNGYICEATMEEVFKKIARGELTFEQIEKIIENNAEKENASNHDQKNEESRENDSKSLEDEVKRAIEGLKKSYACLNIEITRYKENIDRLNNSIKEINTRIMSSTTRLNKLTKLLQTNEELLRELGEFEELEARRKTLENELEKLNIHREEKQQELKMQEQQKSDKVIHQEELKKKIDDMMQDL